MRVPEELIALVDDGIIDEVLRPLMSGKEAQIYLVKSGGQECVAKVYKDANNRSFKHRADYTEGRKVRNSRDQRAIDNRSRHGRDQDEASWRNTEVDTIYKLHYAGVRVPTPLHYLEGVLVMELVKDDAGMPAPRLGDVRFAPGEASEIYQFLIQQVVRMACAGVVHGDLSDFNVLIGAGGPVVIDFPQAVDPARNLNARKLLLRDVDNLHRFVSRFVPGSRRLSYGEEIWNLLEQNTLTPETRLTGHVRGSNKRVDTDLVLALVGEANRDEQRRRERSQGGGTRGPSAGAVNRQPSSPTAPGAPRPRRVEIVIPTSHRSLRAPTGDWPRGARPGAVRPGGPPSPRPGAQGPQRPGDSQQARSAAPGSSRPGGSSRALSGGGGPMPHPAGSRPLAAAGGAVPAAGARHGTGPGRVQFDDGRPTPSSPGGATEDAPRQGKKSNRRRARRR